MLHLTARTMLLAWGTSKVVCIWQSALFRFTPLSVSFRVAPCSVSHHFRFVPFRGVPCRKFSVSFRFAYCRVARFPFHSVSWYGVSQIFVSFRFVSCRVPIVPFRPVSHFPCHTVPFRLGYGSDIYIYIYIWQCPFNSKRNPFTSCGLWQKLLNIC